MLSGIGARRAARYTTVARPLCCSLATSAAGLPKRRLATAYRATGRPSARLAAFRHKQAMPHASRHLAFCFSRIEKPVSAVVTPMTRAYLQLATHLHARCRKHTLLNFTYRTCYSHTYTRHAQAFHLMKPLPRFERAIYASAHISMRVFVCCRASAPYNIGFKERHFGHRHRMFPPIRLVRLPRFPTFFIFHMHFLIRR